MKKLLTILLLMLLLFNMCGYRAWFYYLQQQSQQQLAEVIDKDTYRDSELITMKVPISLPYFNSWKEFEKYDGNIEIDGRHYSYVKRKIENDTLILLCLPNKEQNKLTSDEKNFEKLVNSYHAPANNKPGSPLLLVKLLTGEYYNNITVQLPLPPVIPRPGYITPQNNFYRFYSVACPWQPPDFIC